jgi:5-methylcytosine-specific restriction endonuclease McrA
VTRKKGKVKPKKNKEPVPLQLKESLKDAAGRCCVLCQIPESPWVKLQIHHIVRRIDGGSNDPSNLVPICALCHSKLHSNG